MTPEEYERLKEAEKEHLRKLKKLKETARLLDRQKKVSRAVTDMTSSMQDRLDEHADIMDQIAEESALSEARLEIAMEASETADRIAREISDEEEVRKAKAKELIRQMKDVSDEPETKQIARKKGQESDEEKSPKESSDDLPDKTIGRMKP